jgi:ATP-dependent RNA helicase DDX19/DBP5
MKCKNLLHVQLFGLSITHCLPVSQTKTSADEIARRMISDGHKVSVIHGSYEGKNRDDVLDDFRTGATKVLITTNVLARGIDVSSVNMVINYDIPMKGPPNSDQPDPETYLHRIGRTGRFGRVGVSITFISDEKSYNALTNIANGFGIDLVQLSTEDWDETEKKIQSVLKSARAQAGFVPSANA